MTPHPTIPDLYISKDGRVFMELRGARDAGGYMNIKVPRKGKSLTTRRHVLVLEATEGPRPKGAVARHLNGDPRDDRPANLTWARRLKTPPTR